MMLKAGMAGLASTRPGMCKLQSSAGSRMMHAARYSGPCKMYDKWMRSYAYKPASLVITAPGGARYRMVTKHI